MSTDEQTTGVTSENIFTQIKNKSKKGLISVIFILVGLVAFHLLGWFFPSLQFQAAAVMIYGIEIGLVWVFDKFVATRVEFQDGVKDDPIATAIFFFSHCCLVIAAEVVAVLPFFSLK